MDCLQKFGVPYQWKSSSKDQETESLNNWTRCLAFEFQNALESELVNVQNQSSTTPRDSFNKNKTGLRYFYF